MSYLATGELAASPTFRLMLQGALLDKAGQVLAEDQSDMDQSRAEKRTQLAWQVMPDPATQINRFVWFVLANREIAQSGWNTPDDTLLWQLGEIWDQVAGVTAAEREPA